MPRKVALPAPVEPIGKAAAQRSILARDVAVIGAFALAEAAIVLRQAIGGDHPRAAVALLANDLGLAGIGIAIRIDPAIALSAVGTVEALLLLLLLDALLLLLDALLALDLAIRLPRLTIDILLILLLRLLLLLCLIGAAVCALHAHLLRGFLLLRSLLLCRALLHLPRAAIVARTLSATIAAILVLGARLVIVAGLG